ncbi:sensor histidine kinase [Nocardioides plantarum]|uniref:Sensor histidine kinase n=1 Tax=Nocardioides plantarum TaxID=29299 RepID=A0ABV5KCI4_9ACTN|nr:histidine kinase [Nocardioides plantarum]
MTERRALRITVGARLFALLAIGAPVLYEHDRAAVVALVGLSAIWVVASLLERLPTHTVAALTAEAVLTGVACGAAIGSTEAVLLALAVPPFVAAVVRGALGALLALGAELATAVGLVLVLGEDLSADESFALFTWSVGALGLGMIGTFLHASFQSQTDELAPYLDAQRLLRQLVDLSSDLSSGLDVASLAGAMASEVGDRLPTTELAIYVPRGEVLVPLVSHGGVDDRGTRGRAEQLALESWARSAPIVDEHVFAFPLGSSVVVAGRLSPSAGLDVAEVERTILGLPRLLEAKSVQLDTALLFADFRDSASADERKRLAREMHDGVAQDIASLGYLVDALAARPADEAQAGMLVLLRDRISNIVAEVRQSVLTLRTSIGEADTLGVAIGAVARHLSESSQIPIQVTLDEHSTRLRPEVEAELFRITQEAMNNAIKHAECTKVEVHCQVHAPSALITITDDGRGLQPPRSDSHGLKIMRERARLARADLAIIDRPEGGLRVTVRLA